MWKLTITDKYNLFKYNKPIESFNAVSDLVDFNKRILNERIISNEIYEAIKFVNDTTHNTMEFGYNGFFTCSYYDDKVEE